jgi:hypothetical protein
MPRVTSWDQNQAECGTMSLSQNRERATLHVQCTLITVFMHRIQTHSLLHTGYLADFTLLSTDNLSFTSVLGLINCQNHAALNDFDVLLCIGLALVKLGTYTQLIGHSPHSHLSAFSDLREARYSSLAPTTIVDLGQTQRLWAELMNWSHPNFKNLINILQLKPHQSHQDLIVFPMYAPDSPFVVG